MRSTAGAPLGALVIRFAAAVSGVAGWERAAERREAWDGAGVLLDELSAPVLVLNLGAAPDSLAGRVLSLHAAAGEPCRLSVRQLRRAPPRFLVVVRALLLNPSVAPWAKALRARNQLRRSSRWPRSVRANF